MCLSNVWMVLKERRVVPLWDDLKANDRGGQTNGCNAVRKWRRFICQKPSQISFSKTLLLISNKRVGLNKRVALDKGVESNWFETNGCNAVRKWRRFICQKPSQISVRLNKHVALDKGEGLNKRGGSRRSGVNFDLLHWNMQNWLPSSSFYSPELCS